MTAVQNRAEHSKYLDSLDRLLHNYLAAAFSLSAVMNDTAKARLGTEYADYERKVPYRSAGTAALVFGLRHEIQHRALPVVLSHMEARQVAPGQWESVEGFILPVAGLRALKWRDRPARDYVEALEADVDLRATAQEFTATMSKTVDSLVGRLRKRNAEALRGYDALHLELSAISAPFARAYLKMISEHPT